MALELTGVGVTRPVILVVGDCVYIVQEVGATIVEKI